MAGTIAPFPYHQFFTDSGAIASGYKLYSYSAGTSTLLSTYSDKALAVPNANPVVLDAAGRAKVFLSNASYKFVLKTAADVDVWTIDGVDSFGLSAINSAMNDVCDGRITLSSGVPVPTGNVTAATTIYYAPYIGNRIALYDTATEAWALSTFSELSLSLGADAANLPYDLFAFLSGGVVTLERVAWTNGTTRATALTRQDGVLVKSGSLNKRYLGTYCTTSAAGQCEDSTSRRFVWNFYNRVGRLMSAVEATNSWTYTLATWRQANAAAANKVEFVVGTQEDVLQASIVGALSNTSAAVTTAVACGLDSTSAPASGQLISGAVTQVVGTIVHGQAQLRTQPTVGYHYCAWLEHSDPTGTTTWYGDNGGTIMQAGLVASLPM
jgi:hypothetical protein